MRALSLVSAMLVLLAASGSADAVGSERSEWNGTASGPDGLSFDWRLDLTTGGKAVCGSARWRPTSGPAPQESLRSRAGEVHRADVFGELTSGGTTITMREEDAGTDALVAPQTYRLLLSADGRTIRGTAQGTAGAALTVEATLSSGSYRGVAAAPRTRTSRWGDFALGSWALMRTVGKEEGAAELLTLFRLVSVDADAAVVEVTIDAGGKVASEKARFPMKEKPSSADETERETVVVGDRRLDCKVRVYREPPTRIAECDAVPGFIVRISSATTETTLVDFESR